MLCIHNYFINFIVENVFCILNERTSAVAAATSALRRDGIQRRWLNLLNFLICTSSPWRVKFNALPYKFLIIKLSWWWSIHFLRNSISANAYNIVKSIEPCLILTYKFISIEGRGLKRRIDNFQFKNWNPIRGFVG